MTIVTNGFCLDTYGRSAFNRTARARLSVRRPRCGG